MRNPNRTLSRQAAVRFQPVVATTLTFFAITLLSAAFSRPLAAKLTRRLAQASQAPAPAMPALDAARGISGRVVDGATGAPVQGGGVVVALEQPDGTGTDVVFTQSEPDASGRFSFPLLPQGSPFDLVAVAVNGSGVAYDATVVVNVPDGARLGDVPLVHESAAGPAKIQGVVTAASASGPSNVRVTVSAIQTIRLDDGISIPVDVPQTVVLNGGDTRPVTIPGGPGTSADVLLNSSAQCPASASNVNCARYTMVVPASNPSVGQFATGKISYARPAAGPALYSVRADAFMPYGTASGVCIPSFQTANDGERGGPLTVSPGDVAVARIIAFTGCW